jgi:ribosomal protein S4E
MDVLEIPSSKAAFRVVPVKGKGLTLIKTAEDTKAFKICRINDKKMKTELCSFCLKSGILCQKCS